MEEKVERNLEEPLERKEEVSSSNSPAPLELDAALPELDHPGQSTSKEASIHDSDGQNIALSKQPTAQDWTGPNDPGNALNWSFNKRFYHLSMISLLCFATYAARSFSFCASLSDHSRFAGRSAPQYILLAFAKFKSISMFQNLRLCSPFRYILLVSALDQSSLHLFQKLMAEKSFILQLFLCCCSLPWVLALHKTLEPSWCADSSPVPLGDRALLWGLVPSVTYFLH